MIKRSATQTLGIVGLCAALGSVPAQAVKDPMERPSTPTKLAASSLLTDIHRAGDRLVAVGERGHIVHSDNAGETWTQSEVPVSTTLTGVHFPTETHGWAVGHSGVILHSNDGGKNWERQFDGEAGIKKVIEAYDEMISDLEARIDESDDEDEIADLEWELDELIFTQEDLEMDLEEFGPWEPLLDVHFEDDEHGFAVGSYGHIYRTSDGGESWETNVAATDNSDRFHFNAITRIEGGSLFIASESGAVFHSDNNGESWEMIETPYHGSYFGVIGTGYEDEVLAFGLRGNVYRSTDQGETWDEVSSDTSRTLNSGHRNEDGEIALVGNDGAVVYSDDAGESFNAHIRASRHSYVAVSIIPGEGLVLVGERGALRTDRRGRDLLLEY